MLKHKQLAFFFSSYICVKDYAVIKHSPWFMTLKINAPAPPLQQLTKVTFQGLSDYFFKTVALVEDESQSSLQKEGGL